MRKLLHRLRGADSCSCRCAVCAQRGLWHGGIGKRRDAVMVAGAHGEIGWACVAANRVPYVSDAEVYS